VVFAIASRALTPVQFGLVALAMAISSLTAAIAPTGFGEALVQRQTVTEAHFDSVFWVCLGAGVAAVGLSAVVSLPVATHFHNSALIPLITAVSTKAIFDMSGVVPMAILTRKMSFHLVAVRTTIASLVAAGVCLGLLWAGWGMWALAMSQVAASAANMVGAFAAAKWRPSFRFDRPAFIGLAKYGVFASGTKTLGVIYPDQLLVGLLLGPAALGVFTFSRRIFQMFNDVIAGALSSVSHAYLSSMQDEKEKIRTAFILISFLSASLAFAVFGGIAATAKILIPTLFGPAWIVAIWPVRGFCVIGLISSVGFVQAALINSQGHAKWWFYYQLGKQIALLATLLIAYRWGISATIFAMVACTALCWPFSVAKAAHTLEMKATDYLRGLAAPTVATASMVAAVLAIQRFTTITNPWLELCLLIAVGGAVYITTVAIFGRRMIKSVAAVIRPNR
jgi:O-antigen/teichoic acid export membrane protein